MIYEKIYEPENLQAAWERVRVNKPGPGIDRITWDVYAKNLSYNLQLLHNQLRDETYKPLPVTIFNPIKPSGSTRIIGVSTIRDRVVQQALARVITPYFEKFFLPCSFAYRSGHSALSAVKKAGQLIASGNLWALQMDVEKFFDTMDHEVLLELIRKVIDEKPLIRLVSKLLKGKIFREMGLFDNLIGSQQGSGISPLLSNIYMHPVDSILWQHYKDRYIRYSDDITLFADEREKLEEAQGLIEKGLKEMKLAPNQKKTAITHVSAGIVCLGFHLDIKGKGPSHKAVEELLHKLSSYDRLKKTDPIPEKLNEAIQIIRGWYNYYKTLRPLVPGNILSLLAIVQLADEFGELQLARDLVKGSHAFPHQHPEIHLLLGDHFARLGMESAAIKEYSQALELDPDLFSAKEKIRRLQGDEKNIHQAIEKTRLVIHHNPAYREGYQRLAEYYSELGLYGFAEKAQQKALEIDDEPEPMEAIEEKEETPDDQDFDYRQIDQELFLDLFKGRKEIHARQWVDEQGRWGFGRVERPVKIKDVYKHLQGEITLALYPVTATDGVHFIVFDVDTARRSILESGSEELDAFRDKAHQEILRIKSVCEQLKIALYIEDSGYKGRHGWLFFSEEVPAGQALSLGREIMKKAGGASEGVIWELFPMGKSERHQSIIKLPLGINRKNNRRCLFLTDENHPWADQNLLLKSIQKNHFNEIAARLSPEGMGLPETSERAAPSRSPVVVPPNVQKMVDGCRVIQHLINKARDTNYLSHYERLCLLYTLSFAGEEGSRLLHRVISYCINYDYRYTQGQIDRRKESPISCARIMEYFPELTESLSCNCTFDLPPRSYPSPILFLLEAEMEAAAPVASFIKREPKAEPEEEEDAPSHQPEAETEGIPLLDFEQIFSSESENPQAMGTTRSFEGPSAGTEVPPVKDQKFLTGAAIETDSNIQEGEQKTGPEAGKEEPAKIKPQDFTASPFAVSGGAFLPEKEDELWGLAVDYLRLKHSQEKTRSDLNKVTRQLGAEFEKLKREALQTRMGCIQRVCGADGKFTWIITAGE